MPHDPIDRARIHDTQRIIAGWLMDALRLEESRVPDTDHAQLLWRVKQKVSAMYSDAAIALATAETNHLRLTEQEAQ